MKKLLPILVILILTSCTNLGADKTKEWEKLGNEHLKLKTTKDKVLFHETKKECKKFKEKIMNGKQIDVECEIFGDVKKYYYVSDKKIENEKMEIEGVMVDEHRRTQNAIIYKKPKKLGANEITPVEYMGVFYGGSPFYKYPETDEWYHTDIATTTIEAFADQTATTTVELILSWFGKKVLAASGDPIYSGSDDGVTVSFGVVTWANGIAGNATSLQNTGTTQWHYIEGQGANDYWRNFGIEGWFFNTSAIGSDTVSAAVFHNYGNAKGDAYWDVELVLTDFDKVGTTLVKTDYENRTTQMTNEIAARINLTDWNVGSYNVRTLTDLTIIDGSGTTGIGNIIDKIFDDDPPLTETVTRLVYANSHMSEDADINKRPKLVVTYSAGAAATAVSQDSDWIDFN